MDLKMGSQLFNDVDIPLLWGARAVLQDQKGRMSIIDLSGAEAKLEILGDKPAPNVEFRPISGGAIEILQNGVPLYAFDSVTKTIRGLKIRLPECQIDEHGTRVGTNFFQNNAIRGFGVGIHIMSDGGLAMGGPLPPGLAKLRV